MAISQWPTVNIEGLIKWLFFANTNGWKGKKIKHSFDRNKRAKIEEVFSEDAFLIIQLNWPSLCLSKIGVSVYEKNYVRKSARDNSSPSINKTDEDKRADNLGIGIDTLDTDGRADKSSKNTDISDINKRTDNSDISTNILDTNNIDGRANKSGTNIDASDINKRVVDLGINIGKAYVNIDKGADSSTSIDTTDADVDRKVDPGTGIDTADIDIDKKANDLSIRIANIDRQAAANNKACISFFFLCKTFFLVFFSELDTIAASPPTSFVSSLSPMVLIK